MFPLVNVPKKHKNDPFSIQRAIFDEAPGVAAMNRLFAGLRGVLFCLKDRQGRYVCANDAFLHRLRIDDFSQLIGQTARQMFPPLLAVGYEHQDKTLLQSGNEIRDRLEMITNANGSLGWYLTDKVPVCELENRVVGIACMSQDLKIPAADDPRMGELAKALRRIRQDFGSAIRIADLAEESGMSLSKFERLTKKVLHVSPRQLLTRHRVEAATQLLKETEDSLGEIAIECGFYDQPSFCRQFKTTTGLTALRYRKLSQNWK